MIACDCIGGCVVCEVDGLPMDPVRFAERQAMDREGHEALARFLAAPARPMAVAVDPTPERLTTRERGRLRRQRLDAEAAGETFTAGMTWSLHTTGVQDRRDSNTTSRLRAGRAIGRTKKERIAGRDV